MDLPEIPAEARLAANLGWWDNNEDLDAGIDAGWPYLCAAVLGWAAEVVLENDDACSDLQRVAAERVRADALAGPTYGADRLSEN